MEVSRRTLMQALGGGSMLLTTGFAGCLSRGDGARTDGGDNGDGGDGGSNDGDGVTQTPIRLVDERIETVNADCLTGSERTGATIEVDDREVRVEGQIRTPTPCYEAVYAGENVVVDTIELYVEAEPDGSEGCVECVGLVEFELTGRLEGEMPEEIVVTVDEDATVTWSNSA
ncbi:MAG: hypothetical protein ACQETI_06910 [Halobacteriota archaeon]